MSDRILLAKLIKAIIFKLKKKTFIKKYIIKMHSDFL